MTLCAAFAAGPVIDIGTQRELFLDRFLIESMTGAGLKLQTPVEKEVSLRFSEPWEGPFVSYVTVIRDGARYRLYYRGVTGRQVAGKPETVTCYAESDDGIHWRKPALGLVMVGGSSQNNVILSDPDYASNFSPVLDTNPNAVPGQRFKALGGSMASGLVAFASPDGIRWIKMREEPVMPPSKIAMYDSQNLAFWSQTEGRYISYFRTFKKFLEMGHVRWISRTTSEDFLHWTQAEEMTFGNASPEHLYVNQTSPYFRAPHLYISTSVRFVPKRRVLTAEQAQSLGVHKDYYGETSDVVLLSTRGGTAYDRTFLESFLRPGIGYSNWVSRTTYPAWNVVQTGPAEMSFYANRDYAQKTSHLRRYALRLDGFSSVHAPFAGGEMRTRPLKFSGSELEINYSTSAAGSLRVEVQNEAGKPIPGFALEDCREIVGDEISRILAWKPASNLRSLAGTPIRLRFVMKDADLYSIRFTSQGAGQ